MGSNQIFVRRATVLLLFLCFVLSIAFVVVLVLLLKPSCQRQPSDIGTDEETTSSPSPTQGPQEPWETNYRIPETTVPLAYDLYLFPNLETGTFSGKVNILIDSKQPRNYFVVHTKYLDINADKSKLYKGEVGLRETGETEEILEQLEYKPNEFWVVRTKYDLRPTRYTLHLDFTGNLTRGIVGFYRSVYTSKDGEARYIATSKFQPTYARRAFPCFDEPSFKSNFTVTLVRPTQGYIALSNMDVVEETDIPPMNKYTEVRFRESVPMVTYLACFIVCDFKYIEKQTKSGKPFRVYAQADQIDRAQYALQLGTNILNYFEDYFGIDYPLPKQDMIAIPDFVSGAMEHWGLITYRETNLLYDERESSSSNKQRVAAVVSHELAHMWFGNLMTLKWWNDLWLNEGFASYIEFKGVNAFEKTWDMMSQFITTDLHHVMDLDGTLNSHPIVQEVNNPDEITEIFDTISYSKGASILRMLENAMGEEAFRSGVHNFLREYKYKNAKTNDLWNQLEAVSNLSITSIMDTWTRQMGYPVLEVKEMGDGKLKLSQERFLRDPEATYDKTESPYRYLWEIEVSYITSTNPSLVSKTWMHQDGKPLTISIEGAPAWIKFNVGQMGFYRVNYPTSMWNGFVNLLKQSSSALSSADRASLINDAFSLAEAGYIGYDIPLGMAQTLNNDEYFVPWDTAYDKLVKIQTALYTTNVYPYIKKFLYSLSERLFGKLGWEDVGSHTQKLLRIIVLELACRSGNGVCLKGAQEKFNVWISQEDYYIPPNLRTKVYKYGMQGSKNSSHWDIMWERYIKEKNAQEKTKLMYGLAQTREPWRLHSFLELAKNETYVRRQDFFSVIRYVSGNPVGNPIAWDFYRSNWDYLVERFTLNDRYLGRAVGYVTRAFTKEFELKELKHFYELYPESGAGTRSRQQALEKVQNNIKWLKKNKQTILEWLKQNSA